MNIGIVTTYDEINYGAFFQALFLKLFLEEEGHSAFFIINPKEKYNFAERRLVYGGRNPFTLVKVMQKIWKFKSAKSTYLNEIKVNSKEFDNLDLLIFGSDEIWNIENCISAHANEFFFGEFTDAKKISYAASAGSSKNLSSYKRSLRDFKMLMVRDENTMALLKSIGLESKKVVDPTLLIECPEYLTFDSVKRNRPYLLYYCVNQCDEFLEGAKKAAQMNDLDLISVGYKHSNLKNYINVGPNEWLNMIRGADIVYTDMFHGAIFASKFKKRLSLRVTEYRRNKMNDLVQTLNLHQNVWKGHSNAPYAAVATTAEKLINASTLR